MATSARNLSITAREHGTMGFSAPLKIATVIPRYGEIGGAEALVAQVTGRLAARPDLEMHVLANRWEKDVPGIHFHRIAALPFPRWWRPIAFARAVRKVIAQHRFDRVHTHERIFGSDFFSFHGIPHRTWIRQVRRKSMSAFDRTTSWVEKKGIMAPSTPLILPVSNMVKDELLRCYPAVADWVKVLHPGVDTHRFAPPPNPAARGQLRRQYGLGPDDRVVLFVGMNFEVKRLDLAIRALAAVKSRMQRRWVLQVVGKGKHGAYQKLAQELGIADRVLFVGVQNNVVPFYQASDLLVMTSEMDTFGLVVLEAMACGLPVVVSQRVGARDLLQDGVNGKVLGDHPDAQQLAAAMIDLAGSKERLHSARKAARQSAKACSWDRMVDTLAKLYHLGN